MNDVWYFFTHIIFYMPYIHIPTPVEGVRGWHYIISLMKGNCFKIQVCFIFYIINNIVFFIFDFIETGGQ